MRRIRTIVTSGNKAPRERWFTVAALSGDLTALNRQYGNIEVADPSLTEGEVTKMKGNFPYLAVGVFRVAAPIASVNPIDIALEGIDALGAIEPTEENEVKPQPAKRGRKPKQ